jgi:hypothetical protein
VKVRIVRQPRGALHGLALYHYHTDHVYDLPSSVASYLVAEGFALVEMRTEMRAGDVAEERRKAK